MRLTKKANVQIYVKQPKPIKYKILSTGSEEGSDALSRW